MEKLKRGDKLYLNEITKTKESAVNRYLSCRDGVVEVFEYIDSWGYGTKTRLFLCEDTKNETISIIRHNWSPLLNEWLEDVMDFDSDSFEFLKALINNKKVALGGVYSLVIDYTNPN